MRILLVVLSALWCSAVALRAESQVPDAAANSGPARVIVKIRPTSPLVLEKAASPAGRDGVLAKALGTRIGVAMSDGRAISDLTQVVFADGVTSDELAARLSSEPDVEYAVPDRRRRHFTAPNDPLYGSGQTGSVPAVGQWYLRAPEGAVQASINVEPAWDVTLGSANIVVADLDTGVRFEHPDLLAVAAGGNLLPGYDMVSDSNVANDGNGRDADASDPGDWVTQAEISQRGGPFYQCTTAPESSSWHGTQTAGLIAALTNNGIGMASVGRSVRLLPVRVLGKCGGFDSDILAGMRWAAALSVPGVPVNTNRAQVLNMSLGGDGTCNSAYQQTVNDIVAAGSTIVVAAGNSAGHALQTPANCTGVIAVGALRHIGTKVGFSDLGPNVTVSAPGGNCVNTAAGTPCLYPILTTSNAGATTPGDSIYTDSLNPSIGTSFSSPLVAGTVALMLSAQPSLTPQQIKLLLQSTARAFPVTGADTSTGPVNQCTAPQLDPMGNPVDQLECYCTTSTCGAGMLDAGAAVMAATGGVPSSDLEVEGLWWNAPAESESGWGINLAHQGDVVFATWFTYDLAGNAWWLSMTAARTATNVYSGTLYQSRGPAFSTTPFDPSQVTLSPVGAGTLAFTDANNGSFSYVVNGVAQTKNITRQVFGTLPVCTFGLHADLSTATNYQDIWWNAPAGSESGWGVNLTEQSNIIFATWFTYDANGNPLWLSATAPSVGPATFSGTLYRSIGPAFNAVPFNPTAVSRTPVGTATFNFGNGNAGTFAYTVNGTAQTKSITRQVFRSPGTLCQ